jgi:SET domain-containing protein
MFKVPTKIKIDHTEGKGLGVFAIEKILKGEIIEECHYVITPREGDVLLDYRFILPVSGKGFDYIIPFGYGCIYNHADKNNASWRFPTDHKAVTFFAIRDIEIGEEICTYYGGPAYWKQHHYEKL